MAKQPTPHSIAVSAALDAKQAIVAEKAGRRINERGRGGQFLEKITEEQWEYALERIRNGDTDANVMRQLGVHRSTIKDKRDRDPAFNARYLDAIEEAYINIAHDIRCVTRGMEGYSSGDTRRDELIAKYDLELAKRFARKALGDKVEIEQRTIQINIKGDDGNW